MKDYLWLYLLCVVVARVLTASIPNLILSELADPQDKAGARYVELYSVDGAGKTIQNSSLYLLRWTNGNSYPTNSTAISLNGLTIGMDHYLVICVPLAANYSFSGYSNNTCDKIASISGPADSNGDDQIAIVNGTIGGDITILDMYGVPGQQGTTYNGHYFQGGHAERIPGHFIPNPVWDSSDWNTVYGNYTTKDMTPRSGSTLVCPASLAPPITSSCNATIQDVMGGTVSTGRTVTICTGFITAIVNNGFFIQETPLKSGVSSGLFINSNCKPESSIGSGIKITGTVASYKGMKELDSVQYQVLSTNKTFAPVSITMPVSSFSSLNAFQGMLVSIVAAASYKIIRSSGYSSRLDLLKRSCIGIDDDLSVQYPIPVQFGGLYSVDTDIYYLRGGQSVTTLKGPLWINTALSSYYHVATLKREDLVVDLSSSPRPSVPSLTGGDIKVVSSNLLNYFITLNVRGANTAEEFQRQAMKTTVALTAMNADIFAFTELENSAGNPAAKDLVSRLNSARPSRKYVATSVLANLDTIGTDKIKVDIVFDSNMFDLLAWAILTDDQVSSTLLSNSTLGCNK